MNLQTDAAVDTYWVTGGSVTLTAVGSGSGSAGVTGTLTGSVSNLTFTHVNIDNMGTTTAVGDCNSKLESMAFSGTIMDTTSAGFEQGGPLVSIHLKRTR